MDKNSPLVTVKWLFDNKDNPVLIILDASLKSPVKGKLGDENKFIPNALKFDWDKFSDPANELPHMMPPEEQFMVAAQELGINNNSIVVVYDNEGIYSSPRVWWMFKAMGFTNCYVLSGGLPLWLKMGYNYTDTHALPLSNGNFKTSYNPQFFSSLEDIHNALNDKDQFVIDARSADRFYGRVDEPRAGLRRGHMPNATNIPFEKVLVGNEMRSLDQIDRVFEHIGNKNSQLIFSCGSGVTACIDALAATLIGYQNISVYDGSWSEWGGDLTNPIA